VQRVSSDGQFKEALPVIRGTRGGACIASRRIVLHFLYIYHLATAWSYLSCHVIHPVIGFSAPIFPVFHLLISANHIDSSTDNPPGSRLVQHHQHHPHNDNSNRSKLCSNIPPTAFSPSNQICRRLLRSPINSRPKTPPRNSPHDKHANNSSCLKWTVQNVSVPLLKQRTLVVSTLLSTRVDSSNHQIHLSQSTQNRHDTHRSTLPNLPRPQIASRRITKSQSPLPPSPRQK